MNENDSAATASAPTAADWMFRTLACVAVLTIAADFLTYGFAPGLGWALFVVLLWAGVVWNRDLTGYHVRGKDVALLVMLAASAFQMLNRPSFSNGLVVMLLTIYIAGHTLYRVHPWWQRFAHAIMAVFAAPARWFHTAGWFSAIQWKIGSRSKTVRNLSKLAVIVLPSVILVSVFLALLGNGNAVLGNAIGNFVDEFLSALDNIELPSIGRMFFWGFMATLILGLLWRSQASLGGEFFAFASSKCRVPQLNDVSTAVWGTRAMLISVNAVFFVANTIDVIYLWNEAALPRDLTLSEFVHKGTHNLILSVVLAAVIIGFLFSQRKEVTRARGQRVLACVWIGQNLLLVSSVLLRLKMYVDAYQLTLLRVHLALFLALVVVGFFLLAVRVMKERSFAWLFGANLLASFLLFFFVQFWDTRRFVAEYNVSVAIGDPGREPDINYLLELDYSAFPALRRLAEEHEGLFADSAAGELAHIAMVETALKREEPWQEFSIHRARMRGVLDMEEHGWKVDGVATSRR